MLPSCCLGSLMRPCPSILAYVIYIAIIILIIMCFDIVKVLQTSQESNYSVSSPFFLILIEANPFLYGKKMVN